MLVPDYTCPNCGGTISSSRVVYVHEVSGAHWEGTAMLRCENCKRAYEKPISMMVLDDGKESV